ncbi:MAG: cbb3-type cytochrome c oxidase subunit II, partial [Opitutales bacterium]
MSDGARSRRAVIAAVAIVAATYLYFLLFAEFALLRLVPPGWPLRAVMVALGVGGVCGSVAAARAFFRPRLRSSLAAGFLVAAVGAQLALMARSGQVLLLGAWLAGLGLGWLTVTLASGLRALLGNEHLGLACGLGTGLAYAACNVPRVFAAAPRAQTWIALAVVLTGAALTPWLEARPERREPEGDFRRGPAGAWIAVLLALVWLDSAAFFIIQQTPALKAAAWAGAWTLEGNALMHFGTAVVAGLALDRGRRMELPVLAGALLVGACLGLEGRGAVWAPLLYTAGVSLYSTVLIYYPARGGRPGLTAAVYVVAGWGGSALGIGMAQDLQRIPAWFLALAAAVIFAAWVGRRRLLLGGLAALAVASPRLRADDNAMIRLGREVYLAEGCIHCHSQYVRPGVAADVARWGPSRPGEISTAGEPPLLGNRRVGPDLTNVGNRRSAEWLRLHQRHPRLLAPGSRMPGY